MFPKIQEPRLWTLFLDRDGVINRKLPGDYVKTWDEFEFLPLVKESLARLRMFFGKMIIISNQQGIGKGLMTENDLNIIHRKMCREIASSGGLIDKIYFCPHLADAGSFDRKPAPGMAWQAKADFSEISFDHAVMVGDAMSDMELAGNLGMIAVYIGRADDVAVNNKYRIDYVFNDLNEFADFLYETNF
ncbi:MAG TPA: HAD-IIIA family hydrolase [Bacteroidales bacterium]|nr:HAD-IIIA family hydrolase [Bacteroidales bacterium]